MSTEVINLRCFFHNFMMLSRSNSLKKVWTEASEEILGRKKQHSKAWISKDTISKVILKRPKKENLNRARTRLQKERAHAEYTELNNILAMGC